ncbi:hypothetical protein ABK040_013388 [Willaertia magna]
MSPSTVKISASLMMFFMFLAVFQQGFNLFIIGVSGEQSLFSMGTYTQGELGIDIAQTPLVPYPLDKLPFETKEIYVGFYHTGFLSTTGELFFIGNNNHGKFGNGQLSGTHNTPSKFNLKKNITTVALGEIHTLVLTSTGEVYGSGCNYYYALGNVYSVADYSQPIQVFNSSYDIVDIQAGYRHSVALTKSGEIYVFGQNTQNQLGNVTNTQFPGKVNFGEMSGKTVKRVRVGAYSTVVETTTNEFIFFGSLGAATNLVPTIIDGVSGNNYTDFQILQSSIVFLDSFGSVTEVTYTSTSFVTVYKGINDNIKILGEYKVLTKNNILMKRALYGSYDTLTSISLNNIKPNTEIVKIYMATRYSTYLTYYLANDSSIYFSIETSKENEYGGAGSSFGFYPLNIATKYNAFNSSKLRFMKPSKSSAFSVFVTEDNLIYYSGNLDSGSLTSTLTPKIVSSNNLLNGEIIKDVSVGNDHALILTQKGEVYGFGSNINQQLCSGFSAIEYYTVIKLSISNVTYISAGVGYSLFVVDAPTGKRVYACGRSYSGETGAGVTGSVMSYVNVFDGKNITYVTAAHSHSFFLSSKGIVYAAGDNSYYRLGIGLKVMYPVSTPTNVSITENVVKVSSVNNVALFLTDKGEVFVTGNGASNTNYDIPHKVAGLEGRRVIDIGVGPDYTLFLTSNGELFGARYGSVNNFGQTGVGLDPFSFYPQRVPLYYAVKSIDVGLSFSFLNVSSSEPTCDRVSYCSNNGACVGPNQCECFSGYSGLDCSKFDCIGVNSCYGHGTCIGPNTCSCNAGYKGSPYCNVTSCENVDNCFNHGLCIGPNQCECFSGYKGLSCSQFSCYCSGHGTCKGPNECFCDKGYSGQYCEILPCSGMGMSIFINGKVANNMNNVLRTSDTLITFTAVDSCGNTIVSVPYNSVSLINAFSETILTSPNSLLIASKTLSVNTTYTVEVRGQSPSGSFISTTTKLYVYSQTALLQINGGNKSISSSDSVTLTAILKDPDELSITPNYKWQCSIESGGNCPMDLTAINSPTLTISSNTFNNAERVILTLSCSIGNVKYVTATAFLQFEKLQLPTISVNYYEFYVSKYKDSLFRVNVIPSDKESVLQYSWSLFDKSTVIDVQKISIAGTDKQDIGIKASTSSFDNLLIEGKEYTLQLNVSQTNSRLNQQVFAFSTINFKVNQAPSSGLLTISPTSGTATQTEFTFTATSFSDIDQPNIPLSYAYGYYKFDAKLNQKERIILVDFTPNTIAKTKLPFVNENTEVFVIARDSLGGESAVSKVIKLIDPTQALTNNEITKLVVNQLNTTKSVNDILLISSLLNTNVQQDEDICGPNNNCNGNGKCNLIEKKCNCNALYSGKYCQLTVSEKIGRENVRDQLLTSVISIGDNSTNSKTTLQTIESIISNTDEINTNVAMKALTYASNLFTNTKDIQLVDQVIKVVSNVIETIESNLNSNTTELNDGVRQTLVDIASQQVSNMIQGQTKSINLSNIRQNIIKDNLKTIIDSLQNNQVKLTTKLMNIFNQNDVLGFETTFIGNQNIFGNEKNVSSNIFRANFFSNNQQQHVGGLTENILFNITVNEVLLESNNLTFVCQYYDEKSKQLSSDGVSVNRIINNEKETIVECSTNHLTDFVIVKSSNVNKNIIPTVSGKKTMVNVTSTRGTNYYWTVLVVLFLTLIFLK